MAVLEMPPHLLIWSCVISLAYGTKNLLENVSLFYQLKISNTGMRLLKRLSEMRSSDFSRHDMPQRKYLIFVSVKDVQSNMTDVLKNLWEVKSKDVPSMACHLKKI
jgi:hypothetical protein